MGDNNGSSISSAQLAEPTGEVATTPPPPVMVCESRDACREVTLKQRTDEMLKVRQLEQSYNEFTICDTRAEYCNRRCTCVIPERTSHYTHCQERYWSRISTCGHITQSSIQERMTIYCIQTTRINSKLKMIHSKDVQTPNHMMRLNYPNRSISLKVRITNMASILH
jgi:hypothetical protein